MADEWVIGKAAPGDLPAIVAIAEAAYTPYIARIGKRPAPMDADFTGAMERGELFVLAAGEDLAGYIVTFPKDGAQFVENVAVAPQLQGQGLGRRLLDFAEAEALRNSLVRMFLYTNVHMTENLEYYPSLGYKEYKRAVEDGFEGCFSKKG
jgi:ribosomal protein S18 acetylase RimI-like enzyme